mgnify:CR=1 FL=1
MKILLILVFFLLIGCTRFSGDHPFPQLRQMWYTCIVSIRQNAPWIPPPSAVQHCDCMIDSTREKYKSDDYNKMENLEQEFSEISTICMAQK